MDYKIKCPCCNENLVVSLQDTTIFISSAGDNSSDIEVSEILSGMNIEFG
ncbi:hypothetical protein [Brevibacillus gelatini]|nr:hypothetical protein [Brevibacillus gelatini]